MHLKRSKAELTKCYAETTRAKSRMNTEFSIASHELRAKDRSVNEKEDKGRIE